MKSIGLLCLAILFLGSSCKTNKVDLIHLENNGELILSMERTPCFGDCPVYEMQLYSNGLLLYNGKRYTEKSGCHYLKVSKEKISELTAYILNAGFFELQNKYPVSGRPPSDLPGCTIYFKNESREKTIEEHGWETPSSLTDIEKKVDSLFITKKLQFCDN